MQRLKSTGADVVGLDWTVDMADARKRLGNDVSLQGNVDPVVLFSTKVRALLKSRVRSFRHRALAHEIMMRSS